MADVRWGGFALWAIAGVVLSLGGLSIQVALLAVVAGVAVAGWRWPAALGVLTGAGGVALFVAFLNRSGPGDTCVRGSDTIACTEHLDPTPWLLVGLALIAISLVAFVRRSRRTRGEGLASSASSV